jgi:bifunctional DNA-binding transcriptional regulator/antitoxin component of YhaV-PrlF toxin-antitoxin module
MTVMIVDKRGRAIFPDAVRRDLGLSEEEATLVILARTPRGTYEMVPASMVPKDQPWFRHTEMHRDIAEAETDFLGGRRPAATRPDGAAPTRERP